MRCVGNRLSVARHHFFGLRQVKPDLVGVVLLDRNATAPPQQSALKEHFWNRREIENYLAVPASLRRCALHSGDDASGPLFKSTKAARRASFMEACFIDPAPRWRSAT